MAEIVQMYSGPEVEEEAIQNYPHERRYTRWGMTGSIGFHLLLVATVLLVAYLNHLRNLADLLGGVSATATPPDQIEVILPPDDEPPPPTDHPEFVIQKIIPVIPPPPLPKPKPKPKPKVEPMIVHHTVVRPQTQQLQVGSGGLSTPNYPPDARHQRIQGTVVLKVGFDGAGDAAYVDVLSSSGSNILDDGARQWALDHWHNVTSMANKTGMVPIAYRLAP